MDDLDYAQERIEAERESGIAAVLARLPSGESAEECVECGAAIPEARRAAVPGVELCVECAEVAEQQGRVRRG